jgi:hypothetical protein
MSNVNAVNVNAVNVNVMNVNSSMNVPNSLISMLTNLARDVVQSCAARHGFDAEEEMRHLGLDMGVGITFVEKKGKSKKEEVVSSSDEGGVVVGVKSFRGNFPLPYNGDHDESCCSGLKENQFLMTQCQNARKGEDKLCKTCENQASKNENGLPKFGTIEMRKACGIFEYVAPNGKSPVAYSKVMKKLNLSMEQVVVEASKRNMVIDDGHFVEVVDAKSVRSSKEKSKPDKSEEEKVVKGKGRPKKVEKVVELVEPTEDLFATLMASSQKVVEEPVKKKSIKKKVVAKEEAIEEVVSKVVEVEPVKVVEVEPVKVVVAEPVKVVEEPVKVVVAEPVKVVEEEEEEDEEVDDVVRIEYKGVKYLKSENTGVIYNMDEDVVGKWNDKTKEIYFHDVEEEEEEYDEEE